MAFIWILLIGAILLVLGAIVSYFSGIRALQASRRLADYRVRQKYIGRARWSLLIGMFLVAVAAVLIVANRPPGKPTSPAPSAVPPAQIASPAPSPAEVSAATSTGPSPVPSAASPSSPVPPSP